MNKSILAAALTTCAALASSNAMAADGTITFTGLVEATSCTITGGDSPGTAGVIEVGMGTIGKPSIVDGAPFATRDFKLTMMGAAGGCTQTGQVAKVQFTVDGDLTNSGNIKNLGDAGDGVEVQLSLQDGTVLNLRDKSRNIEFPAMGANGDEEVTVTASLVAPSAAAVNEGEIRAVGNYTVSFN